MGKNILFPTSSRQASCVTQPGSHHHGSQTAPDWKRQSFVPARDKPLRDKPLLNYFANMNFRVRWAVEFILLCVIYTLVTICNWLNSNASSELTSIEVWAPGMKILKILTRISRAVFNSIPLFLIMNIRQKLRSNHSTVQICIDLQRSGFDWPMVH